MVGKLWHSTPAAMAETVLEHCPKRARIAVLLDKNGQVWMDMPDAAEPGELVGVYTRSHDPDALAEDIVATAHERGLA